MAKARRGELAVPLPAGLMRRPSGVVVLDLPQRRSRQRRRAGPPGRG